MATGREQSVYTAPVPVFFGPKLFGSTQKLHHIMDLTPPPSDIIVVPTERAKCETPRSHRSSSLLREFKKCRIFCDEVAALTPSKEETSPIISNLENYCSPRKVPKKRAKKNPHVTFTFCESDEERQKDNSPIKIEMVSGSRWTLQPPPRKLNTLTNGANGRKDILTRLHEQNLYFIMQKIINYLDPLDLVNIKDVSVNWRNFTTQIAPRELENGVKLALRSRENLPAENKATDSTKLRNETTPMKTLSIVENRIRSPKRRILQSPELSPVSKRFCYYLKEGKDLKENERLERCPKCRYPARVTETLVALCSRSYCRYEFCSQCRCTLHPGHPCKLLLSPTTSPQSPPAIKRVPVGSKQSKKSLSRLLKN